MQRWSTLFPNRAWSRVGGLTFLFWCIHSYFIFITSLLTQRSTWLTRRVVSRTSFQRSVCKRCYICYIIHLSALCSFSGLSEHATIKKNKQGSIIQQAIISYESKKMWFRKLVYENLMMSKSNMSFVFLEKHLIAVVLTILTMWPLRHIH